MGIPLLFLIPAGVSAAYGLYKGGKAIVDHSDANTANDDARSTIERATKLVDRHRDAAHAVLEDYGNRKLRAFNGPIEDFITTFARLKNVEEIHTPELDKLQMGDFSTASLEGLKQDYQLLMNSGVGLGAGLSSGAALAFGAYNGTMMLATASTGTAISTLSGAAATNATLAWLGGGSIVAGGGGMALGTMVLGGVVAGPALAIMGFIVGNKAEAALADALSNKEKANTCWADAQRVAETLSAIESVTTLANRTFSKVTAQLRQSVRDLRNAIERDGEDYSAYPQESREAVFRAVKVAQLIKAMIDTPILDEAGKLVLSTEKRVQDIRSIAGVELPADDGRRLLSARAEADSQRAKQAKVAVVIPTTPTPLI